MITGNIKNYKNYCVSDNIKKAFEYLEKTDLLSLPMGETIIDDNILIQRHNYKTNALGESFWETHENVIDLQYVANGQECFAYAPSYLLKEVMYNKDRDLKVLKGPVQSMVQLNKGDFAVFFPEDGHMPGLNTNLQSNEVDKFVVKIKL